jgi:hypothetical protein
LDLLPKFKHLVDKLLINNYERDVQTWKIKLKKRSKLDNLESLPDNLEFFNLRLNEYLLSPNTL